MTAARQNGADVRSLADTLIARAASNGGQLTSAEVALTVETAEVTPAQAKKLLRALADSGVTVVVDDSGASRRRVAAARSATPASKATTAKAPAPAAPRAAAAKKAPAKPAAESTASGSAAPAPAAGAPAPSAAGAPAPSAAGAPGPLHRRRDGRADQERRDDRAGQER